LRFGQSYLPRAAALVLLLLCCLAGCEQRQRLARYKGKVMYKNQPLANGSVMFQPEAGIPSRGNIQPDGSFSLTTYKLDDGATIGKNKVRVVSTTAVSQDAAKGELATGASTIPAKYNDFSTTPLEVVVPEAGEDNAVLVIED
jgi:hypothetical protein